MMMGCKNQSRLLLPSAVLVSLFLAVQSSSHVYTDSFPTNDEYDFAILDPDHAFGSPYGGFSRATASRLASLPLKLPNVAEELTEFEPVYMNMRDSQGRPYVCRVYHEDELDPESLEDSMFDTAKLMATADEDADEPQEANLREESSSANENLGSYQPVGAQDASSSKRSGETAKPASNKAATTTKGVTGSLSTAEAVELARELNQRLALLKGMCAQFHSGWWSYEWCCQDKVTQFHVHMDKMVTRLQDIQLEDVTSLGTFSERRVLIKRNHDDDDEDDHDDGLDFAEGMTELAVVTDVFLDGGICPETGLPRVTEAVLKCCSPIMMARSKGGVILNGRPFATDLLTLQSAHESHDGVCEYNITLCTPLLCGGPSVEDEVEELEKETVKVKRKPPPLPETRAAMVTGYDLSEGEIEQMSIREIMEMTFGHSQKACIQTGTGGWWVYELCPGQYVRQFHEVTLMDRISGASSTAVESEHILGRYNPKLYDSIPKHMEWKNVVNATNLGIGSKNNKPRARVSGAPTAHGGNGAYYSEEYSSGDVCDHETVTDSAIKAGQVGEGGIDRATTVRYSCGKQVEMNVKEDSTCHYLVDVSIPALCAHPLFKAPVSKKKIVKCLPAP